VIALFLLGTFVQLAERTSVVSISIINNSPPSHPTASTFPLGENDRAEGKLVPDSDNSAALLENTFCLDIKVVSRATDTHFAKIEFLTN
jgi:hypothetical protein